MGCSHSKGFTQMPDSPRGKEDGVGAVGNSGLSSVSSDGHQVHHLSRNRNPSQFLPPEGSRTVRVPMGNYDLQYSVFSQRGYYPEAPDKPNQDSFCIHTPLGSSPDYHLFGVFDGHGEFGAQCSQFAKKNLCENLLRSSQLHTDPAEACRAAFLATNSQMHADSLDDTMSGTTAITILVRGRTLYVANAGDSRAVIAEKRREDIVAVDLSKDQTPYRTDEFERVKQCGARVMTLDQIKGLKNPDVQDWGTDEGGDRDPPRLWLQNGMYPGTAFTRSIGDSIAESVGVVATPEIFVLDLTPDHQFFVIASDGVFEFLSSQAVVDMVAKFKDPRDACAAVVAESYRLWQQYETRTDDITIIVVRINELTDMVQSIPNLPTRRPLHKVMQATVSESPSTLSRNSMNNRAINDLSRALLRAIESSHENGHAWVPPASSHRKTWEEKAHIERALQDHFLFRKLTDSQCHVLVDCMQRVEVKPGDVVVQQGGEGECFYIVGTGEFEVLATQEEDGNVATKVLHQYTADKLSSFGELALMYNKPPQASVRAVTGGILWALKKEDYRGIRVLEFSILSSLKLLRSVELFSRLTILQLSHVAESLIELAFSDGQIIIDKNACLSALYIVQKGQVKMTYSGNLTNLNACCFLSTLLDQGDYSEDTKEYVVEMTEGTHFGEWALVGECINSLTAVSVGEVVCAVITKEKFDASVGPLSKLSQDECKLKDSLGSSEEHTLNDDPSTHSKIQYSDLEWIMGISATDCSEMGLVRLKGSDDNMQTLKRFSKRKIIELGKEAHVLKERDLMKSLCKSTFVPQVLCTCADQSYVGMLLNCCIICTLASILRSPLDEPSARFCAASVVIALEELHKNSILYRGVSPDVLMLDRSGHLQIVDFRFGKKLTSERAYTICGIADFRAPEIVLRKGHGFAVDWWALGVLIFFMLQAEMPFGSWRESEIEIFARIAKWQLTLPPTFSQEVVDLVTKLLEVDENARLGAAGPDFVKKHPWFDGVDWKGIADGTFPVPQEITSRIDTHLEKLAEDAEVPVSVISRVS